MTSYCSGKWHLGFCSEAYTPLRRGFDTFDGRFVGEEEEEEQEKIQKRHKNHKTKREKKKERVISKKDSKSNRKKQREKKRRGKNKKKITSRSLSKRAAGGKSGRGRKRRESMQGGEHRSDMYSRKAVQLIKRAATDQPLFIYLSLFTKSYPRKVGRVKRRQKQMELFRRENLQDMDRSVASVVQALKSSGRYANSIVIFISDNGAREWSDPSLPNHNAPLRGAKGSVYEGGTKVPALIHSPLVTGGRR